MDFYQALSRVYDIVFPMGEEALKFLKKDVGTRGRILDMACGTGNYAIPLGKEGYEVDAIDLDGETINRAKQKEGAFGVHFIQGDMTQVKEIFWDKSYDGIFCIGNSIVHLSSKEAVGDLIKDVFDMLNSQGKLMIQIINYDRIIKYGVDHLPTINRKDEGVTFIRKYFYREEEEKVDFNTELIIETPEGEKRYQHSTPLLALKSQELINLLKKAGFAQIELYGGFGETPYTEDAYATVVRATK